MEGFAQVFPVEVGIYLGGGDAFVAKHFLYGTKVGSSFYEVGCKRVAESVRGNVLGDTCLLGQAFQHQEDHDAGQLAAAAVKEEDVFAAAFDGNMDADLILIDPDIFDGGIADGDEPLFVAFPDDADVAGVEVEARDTEVDDFADAKPAAVHGFEDGFVAAAFGFAKIDLTDDRLYFFKVQHIGQGSFQLRRFEQNGWIFFDDLFYKTIFEKGADAGQYAGLGGGVQTHFADPLQKGLQLSQLDRVRCFKLSRRLKVLGEFVYITKIGFHRVVGKGALQL